MEKANTEVFDMNYEQMEYVNDTIRIIKENKCAFMSYNYVKTDKDDNLHIFRVVCDDESKRKILTRKLGDDGVEVWSQRINGDEFLFFIYCAG